MDKKTCDILYIKCIDKRETGGKSPNMEPLALRQGLVDLHGMGFTILEIVTDAHSQIPPILSKFSFSYNLYMA